MSKYIVYLTTNTKCSINNEYRIYIGVHKITNKDKYNTYLGCGVWSNTPSTYMYPKSPFQYAVKVYGPSAFKRTTLFEFESAQEAFNKERELVNEDFIKLEHTYNVAIGGDYTERWKPLYQFDFHGNLIKKWEISADAYDFYGLSPNDFDSCKRHKIAFLNSFWATTESININEYSQKNQVAKHIYLYTKNGKLLYEFNSQTECAEFIKYDKGELSRAIRNQTLIKKTYYVSDKIVDQFKPNVRKNYINMIFYVYDVNNNYLGKFKGKELMSIINLHSWDYINQIFNHNHNWYKDFYISTEKIEHVPNKHYSNGISIDVYTKDGDFIETLKTIKEVREKYNVPSSKLKHIQQGERYYETYIFKYNSK